jgi:hypothetical protein
MKNKKQKAIRGMSLVLPIFLGCSVLPKKGLNLEERVVPDSTIVLEGGLPQYSVSSEKIYQEMKNKIKESINDYIPDFGNGVRPGMDFPEVFNSLVEGEECDSLNCEYNRLGSLVYYLNLGGYSYSIGIMDGHGAPIGDYIIRAQKGYNEYIFSLKGTNYNDSVEEAKNYLGLPGKEKILYNSDHKK